MVDDAVNVGTDLCRETGNISPWSKAESNVSPVHGHGVRGPEDI